MIEIMFYMGFTVGEKVYFYHNEDNPVVDGVIRKIRQTEDETLFKMETKLGTIEVPYTCVFKDRELCEAFGKHTAFHASVKGRIKAIRAMKYEGAEANG